MFAAHLFAGYLSTRHTISRAGHSFKNQKQWKFYLAFGVLCAVLPDFDLLYFYTIDNRQHLHHSYWTHIPIFWAIVPVLIYSISRWVFNKRVGILCMILFVNTLLHLMLDTVAGGIYWFYPFSDMNIQWFHITARYQWWVLNYIIHWTFLFEVCIMLLAVYTYYRDLKNKRLMVARDASF